MTKKRQLKERLTGYDSMISKAENALNKLNEIGVVIDNRIYDGDDAVEKAKDAHNENIIRLTEEIKDLKMLKEIDEVMLGYIIEGEQ